MDESHARTPSMPIPQHHAIPLGQAHSYQPYGAHSDNYEQNAPSFPAIPPHSQYPTYDGADVQPQKLPRYTTVPNPIHLSSNGIGNSPSAPAASPPGFRIRSSHPSGATADTPPFSTGANRSETMGTQYAVPDSTVGCRSPFEHSVPWRRPQQSPPQHRDTRYLYEPYPRPLSPPTNHSRPYDRYPYPSAPSTQHHSHYGRDHPPQTPPHPHRTQTSTLHSSHPHTSLSPPPQTLPRSIAHSISEPTSTPSRQSSVYVSGVPVPFNDEVVHSESAHRLSEAQSDHTAWSGSWRPERTSASGATTLPPSVYSSGAHPGRGSVHGTQSIFEYGSPTIHEEPGEYQDESDLPAVHTVPKEGTKKALLIGITYKEQSSMPQLQGCCNDVCFIGQFLKEQGYLEENIRILTDDVDDQTMWPTKANILSSIDWLVGGAKENDVFFFHFSGHGGQIEDEDGDEMPGGLDDTIIPVDHEENGMISDDELNLRLVKPLPRGCRLIALVDACHSGTCMDLPFRYSNNDNCDALVEDIDDKNVKIKGAEADVISFSSCRDDQLADDSNGRLEMGAMTCAFLGAFKDGMTYREFFMKIGYLMNKEHTQKPQLGTSHKINLDNKTVF